MNDNNEENCVSITGEKIPTKKLSKKSFKEQNKLIFAFDPALSISFFYH